VDNSLDTRLQEAARLLEREVARLLFAEPGAEGPGAEGPGAAEAANLHG
jgi:hypothetical protein